MKTSHLLRQHAGQLLIIGMQGTEMSAHLRHFLFEVQPGGIIFFKRNIETPQQCFAFLAACRKTVSEPLFTCVDVEGGTVDRLREILGHTHSAEDVAATNDRKIVRKHGALLGTAVRAFGLNTDFAPVSDLGLPASRGVLGSRTVSADPQRTVTYVREFLRGLADAHVLGCGKHFPGLGEARLDTHKVLPVVNKPWRELWEEDLLPYRVLHKQFPFVMTAHAAYPKVTKDGTPASISRKWLTDILKKKIGYRGIILADDLEMGGVLAAAPMEDAAQQALRAGSDMLLVCHKEEDVHRVFEAIVHEGERDSRFATMVQRAAIHVLKFKARSKAIREKHRAPTEISIRKLREEIARFNQGIERSESQ